MGGAVGYLGWLLVSIATCPRVVDPKLGRFEENRRDDLRAVSWTYRTFEPWIDELAEWIEGRNPGQAKQLGDDLVATAEPAPWNAAERFATWRVESLMLAAGAAIVVWLFVGPVAAVVLGAVAFFGYANWSARSLRDRAAKRRQAVKRHLASAIDLLALMMEVGGGFQGSLLAIARRAQGTPLGEELGRVLRDIESGRPRKDALQAFARRLTDNDVDEFVFAVVQGEELGTPLTSVLRKQAQQINQKRSQWAEKATQEAQVTIVFPAMVIMLACLLIVATPFILNALFA